MSVNSRLKALQIIGQRKAFHRQRIPEPSLNNKTFDSLLINQTETNNYSFDSNNSSLLLNPPTKLTNLVNQFNNNTIIDNNKNVDDNFIHSKYFDIYRFRN